MFRHPYRVGIAILLLLTGICLSSMADQPSSLPEKEEVATLIKTDETRKAPLKSEENLTTQMFSIPAPRGLILDRYGNPLVQTRAASYLALKMEHLKEKGDAASALQAVETAFSGIPELNRFANFTDGFTTHWENRSIVPFPLSDVLTTEEENKLLPIVESSDLLTLETRFIREYPLGPAAAHITGYVSPDRPFQHGPLSEPENLWPPDSGSEGLELAFDDRLSGTDGTANYIYDKEGNVADLELIEEATPGSLLVTTINAPMQELAYRILKENGKPGAMVIVDSLTGDILAMASYPSFDPHGFTRGISAENFAELQNNPASPLFPRATMGAFPPGSTFKPFVALAGMDRGAIRGTLTRFDTPPEMEIDGRTFRNWSGKNEGRLDVRYALLRSSNTWFYQAGILTGGAEILQTARSYGFSMDPDIALPTASGNLPEKKNALANQAVANLAIGQGEVLVTPLQLSVAMSGLSVGTYISKPRLVIQFQDPTTGEIEETFPAEKRSYINTRESDRLAVRAGMWGVVNHPSGTGKAARHELPQVYGKTGTSQRKLGGKDANVAWFAGYVGSNSPRIAFAAIVEGKDGESLSGGKNAAPLIGKFVDTVYSEKEKYHVEVTVTQPSNPLRNTTPVQPGNPYLPKGRNAAPLPPTSTTGVTPPPITRANPYEVAPGNQEQPARQQVVTPPGYRAIPLNSSRNQP